MTHVVMFSSGAGSWAAAKRVVAQHGPADVVLLFADTLMEDEDNYRFLAEAVTNVGARLVTLADGRDPWQVFRDVKFLGNTRIDPCSRVLKRELLRAWVVGNCDPATTTIYLGLDWTEGDRMAANAPRWEPYRVAFPMADKPLLDKSAVLAWMRREGVEPPRLYALGFAHANCGGACVKGGQAQWAKLFHAFPERYARAEAEEAWHNARRAEGAEPVAILRDRVGGPTRPLPLAELRRRIEEGTVDEFDWGGCGCVA